VLAYHAVSEAVPTGDDGHLVTRASHLRSHIKWLLRNGYHMVSAGELAGELSSERVAALTFDDGWFDGLSVVLPILNECGVTATFFICPGLWGAQHPFLEGGLGRLLTAAEAEQLHAAGMELGSHTMSHPDLTTVDDLSLAHELGASKAAIEEVTRRSCRTLAYPFGVADPRVQQAAAQAGFVLGFSNGPGQWRPYYAPRMAAPARHGAWRLALKSVGVMRLRPWHQPGAHAAPSLPTR
jgi:peptidoglycan/xylan/chitin deacetylase (PgdA/CDA1 family)